MSQATRFSAGIEPDLVENNDAGDFKKRVEVSLSKIQSSAAAKPAAAN
jgi:hypothetical protein